MNILVTGASSGIGQQLALDYLAEGHRVYGCGRDRKRLEHLTAAFPDHATPLVFDIMDLGACRTRMANLEPLDLVILNAGTCEYIDAKQFDAAMFKRVVETNLVGLANCIEAVQSRIAPGGRLALMGSSVSYLPLPRAEAYGASKAAVHYLARALSITLAPLDIQVSYIAPGFVDTPLTGRNDFPMPMMVTTERASIAIRTGLAKGKAEIHFPKRFTGLLKAMGAMPWALQKSLVRRMVVRT